MKSRNLIVVFSSRVHLAGEFHSEHWGITPPPQKYHPIFLVNPPPPPSKINKLSKPPFLGNPTLHIGFSRPPTPPKKVKSFSEPKKY